MKSIGTVKNELLKRTDLPGLSSILILDAVMARLQIYLDDAFKEAKSKVREREERIEHVYSLSVPL